MNNLQEKTWSEGFGKEYTERNTWSPDILNDVYSKRYGITREKMNHNFLKYVSKSSKILEIGCNVGNQLRLLQQMGYHNLYGIELQWDAVEKAKSITNKINIINGTGSDIPFRDNYFDVVFTSGVLIHISPNVINSVLSEICRCTKSYIWGFEYYSDIYEEINYRGQDSLLWKANYSNLYTEQFSELVLIKEEKYKYTENNNVDVMFMLEKINE